jgi:uncharacterized protein YcaQ
MPEHLSLSEARRISLAAQGFDLPRPTARVGLRDVRTVSHRLGLLQIDCVNVLVPAHYRKREFTIASSRASTSKPTVPPAVCKCSPPG